MRIVCVCVFKLENSLLLKLLNLLDRHSRSDSRFVKIEFERSIMEILQEPRCSIIFLYQISIIIYLQFNLTTLYTNSPHLSLCFCSCRLPVNECQASQTARVTSNLHASSSTMAVSRVPSPPLPEVNTPVAENWCYTQVRRPTPDYPTPD